MGFLRLKPGRHLQRGVWRDEALRLAKLRFLARIIDRIGSVLVTLGAEVTRRCGRDSSLRDRRQRPLVVRATHWAFEAGCPNGTPPAMERSSDMERLSVLKIDGCESGHQLCRWRLKESAVVRMPSAYGVPANPNSRPNLPESKRYGESL